MEAIGTFLGTFLGPIGGIFHYVFYLPIFNILILIYQAVSTVLPTAAFPIAIVILTLAIRSALIPLTRKQLSSTRRMQMLQPQLKELQARYRSDPQRLMREQQALYKENGVSMYGGCLPLLVQLPFLYALYGSFTTFFNSQSSTVNGKTVVETAIQHLARVNHDLYPFVPHLLSLPITRFLWTDLAHPDPIHLLPIIAGLLTFIQLRMAMPYRKPDPTVPVDAMTQSTRTTQYIMPFVTIFIGWSVPSGLALYWTISTGYSAVQQYFISGGFGSLFVGIPGMEHLVKEQVLTPTSTKPAIPARTGSSRVVDATPPPAPPGGIRGWFQQMRETAQGLVDQQGQQRNQAKAEADEDEADTAGMKSAANGNGNGNGTAASQAARRERRMRESPVLVKPSQPAGDAVDAAIAEATQSNTLPEDQAAAAGSDVSSNGNGNGNGKATTASVSTNGNGATNSNGNGNGRTSVNTQRKPSGKGYSGSRPRNGRPKGGR